MTSGSTPIATFRNTGPPERFEHRPHRARTSRIPELTACRARMGQEEILEHLRYVITVGTRRY
jgi:hypothetical protein